MKNNTVLKIALAATLSAFCTLLIGIALSAGSFISKDDFDKTISEIKEIQRTNAAQIGNNANQIATLLERTKND